MGKPKYEELNMKESIRVVRTGVPIRKAARRHGVPESTLRFRLQQGDKEGEVKRGCPPKFKKELEEMLALHCLKMASLGYGYTRWQVIEMAGSMAETTQNKLKQTTDRWFYAFLNRFPNLRMIRPKKREVARDMAVTEDVLKTYFGTLEALMKEAEVFNIPGRIWNVDETGVTLDHNPPKILARSGSKPVSVTAGRSATTTIIAAVSALGETIPPFIIYKGKRLSDELTKGGLKGTLFRSSESGWSNAGLFLDFFKNHFLRHVTTRPCLLLYDGHATHYTIDVIQAAKSEGVYLFVLPPHSSHCLQPLDVSFFSPFKNYLSTEFHKFLHENTGRVVTKEDLPHLIASAFLSAAQPKTIMAGFRKAGIFPFSPNVLTENTPTMTVQPKTKKFTRRERRDNRAVKILFQEIDNKFLDKSGPTSSSKRSKLIPKEGAHVTAPSFQERREMASTSGRSKKADQRNATQEEEGDDEDEVCVVCGKWQPDKLQLHKALKFVEWGQCSKCSKWVHLAFCTPIKKLTKKDVFICPLCHEE